MSVAAEHALKKYQSVGAHAAVAAADPYRLVQLMLENILQRVAAAKGHMERDEVARKGEQVSKAIRVIGALNAALNLEAGGEVAANLKLLYDYCAVRLAKANARNEADGFEEVMQIVRTVKEGWDGIGDAARGGTGPEAE
jgi:flagellar secretion chaperone FliS